MSWDSHREQEYQAGLRELNKAIERNANTESARSWCRWAGETGGGSAQKIWGPAPDVAPWSYPDRICLFCKRPYPWSESHACPVPAPDPVSKAIAGLRVYIHDLTEFLYRDDRVRAGAKAGDALRVIKADYEKRAAFAAAPAGRTIVDELVARDRQNARLEEFVRKIAKRAIACSCATCARWNEDIREAERLTGHPAAAPEPAAPRPARANEAVTEAMVELVRQFAAVGFHETCKYEYPCSLCALLREARRLVRMAGPA